MRGGHCWGFFTETEVSACIGFEFHDVTVSLQFEMTHPVRPEGLKVWGWSCFRHFWTFATDWAAKGLHRNAVENVHSNPATYYSPYLSKFQIFVHYHKVGRWGIASYPLLHSIFIPDQTLVEFFSSVTLIFAFFMSGSSHISTWLSLKLPLKPAKLICLKAPLFALCQSRFQHPDFSHVCAGN